MLRSMPEEYLDVAVLWDVWLITTVGSSKPDEKEKEASCELPVLC